MGIARLYSADVYVRDVERALAFYVDARGLEKRVDEPVDEEGHRWVEVGPKGAETALILSHGFGSWAAEKVGGWARVILAVEDMASTVADLKAKGIAFEDEAEESPWGIYATVRDPDGNILGLLQGNSG